MPKFSANIATLFTERPFLQRAAAAKQSGFAAIEMQFIHEMPLDDLVRAKEEAGLALAVFNLPAGDLTSGGPGLAAMPDRRRAFREAVDQAVGMAKRLAPVNVNILPGWPPAELDRDACWRTMVENVAVAADALGEVGVRVVVEALNTRDRPGAFLSTSDQVLALIDESNCTNLAIEYDIYHMQIMEGDLAPTLERLMPRIGHIQFADTPGRHQPGTGEINFPFLFKTIDRLGYEGWIGAEYGPTGRTEDSLDWMASAADR